MDGERRRETAEDGKREREATEGESEGEGGQSGKNRGEVNGRKRRERGGDRCEEEREQIRDRDGYELYGQGEIGAT